MAIEVADDLRDKTNLPDRLGWLGLAFARFAVAAGVAIVFFFTLAILELRFDAESAVQRTDLTPAQNEAVQTQLHALLSLSAGSREERAQAATTRAEAAAFAKADSDMQERARLLGTEVTKQDREGRRLISAAEQAECGQPGLAPSIPAALACQNLTATATVTQALAGELNDSQGAYNDAQTARRESEKELRRLEVIYEDAAIKPGATLAPAVTTLRAFDQVQAELPPALQYVSGQLFAMDTAASGTILSFVAGLLGSTCLLFILLTFPNYLPLTFGAGEHFFLRMATGGAVAVLVVLLLRLGTVIQVAELQQAQDAINRLALSLPAQQALIGVVSGFLAEQIAKWVKDYVDAAFHGVRAAPPAAPAPVTSPPVGEPAMGPGAEAEMRG
jgi:uncharacterized membrane protein YeaQ/YmgE (transglycosylase-associated protein family)